MNDPDSPAALLAETYAAIGRTRMAGLPFVNPALTVEAIGFAPWSHHWLGVLVTPWSMNLVLLPRDREHWQAVRCGDTLGYTFPAGVFEFIAHDEPPLGALQTCSLFSPMFEFADQDTARVAASAARAGLFDPANREVLAPEAAPEQRPPMTKRDFLRLGQHER